MTPLFDHKAIARLAGDLANHLRPAMRSRAVILPARYRKKGQLPGCLEPGVALFTCRLSGALHGGDDRLLPVLDRFFADPATAEALLLPATGAITEAAVQAFIAAEGDRIGLDRRDFDDAMALLIAATGAILYREPPSTPLEQDEEPPSLLLLSARVLPELADQAKAFVAAFLASGLDYVEDGGAVAADGATVIFSWHSGWSMAVEPPQLVGAEESVMEPPLEELAGEDDGKGLDTPSGTGAPPPPPPPPAVLPSIEPPAGEQAVALRLDAALPERVSVGRVFDLAVAVRRPTSPPLAPDDLTRRDSAGFEVAWPAGAAFVRLRVQVSAPDCDILGGDNQEIRLPAGSDGPTVFFQLTPRQTGPLSVIITVYQETDWIGSTRLRTEVGQDEIRGALAMTVESRPLGDAEVNLVTLRQALDDGYNDSELRDLCFELEIDYEDLPGDNQSAKARELVLYAKRHDLIARLVERVMKDRPHLLAPA